MVFAGGTAEKPELKKPDRAMTVRDLFLHTSGITYSFLMQGGPDEIYRKKKIEHPTWPGDLKSFCEAHRAITAGLLAGRQVELLELDRCPRPRRSKSRLA